MDLGIRNRRAIVCAASRGLGSACASALAGERVDVVINGRDPDALSAAQARLTERHGDEVGAVVGDIRLSSTHDALLATCPEPDILVINNGGSFAGLT